MNQLKQIVEHFHGQNPTDEEVLKYCEEQGFDGISAGDLEDWTFQYDTDKLRIETLPEVCRVIGAWVPPSAFVPQNEQQAAFRKLEQDILAIFEARDVRFDIASSVMENLSQIGSLIKNASLRATDKKVAIANTLLAERFGMDPNKVGVGSYAQLCKELAEQASDAVVQ